jgi:creatinine amidohydrolase
VIHRLDELDPAGIEARLAAWPGLVLPLGTVEWHSHHLPLGLDMLKAAAIAERVAAQTGAVLAPPAWWAAGGVPFPYTLRLPGSLVEPVLREVLAQLAAMGFRGLLVLNGHYGLENTLAVRRAALAVTEEAGATVIALADYELLTDLGNRGDHAGTWETSLLLAARPELVRLDVGGDLPGVIGDDPRGDASAHLGRRGLDVAAERAAQALDAALAHSTADRVEYAAALRASVSALERLWQLREQLPRELVPPVQTAAWLLHVEALRDGDYERARAAAEQKLADPAS